MTSPRKIKVLVASEPGSAGVKRHVVEYLSRIDVARFEILFVYSLARVDASYAGERESLAERGIRLQEMHMSSRVTPWSDLRAVIAAARIIADFQPDIVHAHSSKAGLIFRLGVGLARTRAAVIYTPHALAAYYSKFFQWIEQILGKVTDLLIAVSESERDDLIRWKIKPAEKVRVVNLGVAATALSAIPATPPLIVSCGRICAQKRSLLFFQAMELVAAENPKVRFRWIGDFSGDAESRAVREFLAVSPHRARFEITGWIEDPIRSCAEATVFCLLSRYEGLSYAVADAMTLGLPVVGVNVTGIRDLVRENNTGRIVEANPEAIAAAVCALLNHPEEARRLGTAGGAFVTEKHDLTRMVSELESIYHELAAANSARR